MIDPRGGTKGIMKNILEKNRRIRVAFLAKAARDVSFVFLVIGVASFFKDTGPVMCLEKILWTPKGAGIFIFMLFMTCLCLHQRSVIKFMQKEYNASVDTSRTWALDNLSIQQYSDYKEHTRTEFDGRYRDEMDGVPGKEKAFTNKGR